MDTSIETDSRLIPPARKQRGLCSYLLYPRPEEWSKAVIAPVVFACTAWSINDWNGWRDFFVLWVILEFLIYHARYQWNDILGIADDADHPERISRGRLPIGQTDQETLRNILLSRVVAVTRVVVALAVGWFTGTIVPVLLLIVLVFGIAIIYEIVRHLTSRNVASPLDTTLGVVTVWITVSLGYAVRAGLGLTTGGLQITDGTAIIGMLCVAAFGTMFVLLNWVLEATSHCFHDSRSALLATQSGMGAAWYWLPTLPRKPHLAALLPYLDIFPRDGLELFAAEPDFGKLKNAPAYCGLHKVLLRPGSCYAPWNVAYLFAVLFGAFLGVRMSDAPAQAYFIVPETALAGGLLILTRGQSLRLAILALVTIVQFVSALQWNAPNPFLCPAPWLLITAMYVLYRGWSYRDLKRWALQPKIPGVERRHSKPSAGT
jgi:hypothetical protein